MAYAQIKHYGFNETVGLVSFEESEGSPVRPYSKTLQATMDLEARKLVAKAYQTTERLLTEHSDKLEAMATALLEKETLNYDDVEKLLGPPPRASGYKKHLVSPADFERELQEQGGPEGDKGDQGNKNNNNNGDTKKE